MRIRDALIGVASTVGSLMPNRTNGQEAPLPDAPGGAGQQVTRTHVATTTTPNPATTAHFFDGLKDSTHRTVLGDTTATLPTQDTTRKDLPVTDTIGARIAAMDTLAPKPVAVDSTSSSTTTVAVDSVVAQPTVAELLAGMTRPTLAPSHLEDSARFDFYKGIVEKAGGQLFGGGRYEHHMLLLRGVDMHGRVHPTRISQSYDDVFVVLGKDGSVLEVAGATHPNFIAEESVMRLGGVGMVDANQTLLMKPHVKNYNGMPAWHAFNLNGRDGIPATRNGAGVSDDATRTRTVNGKTYDDVYGGPGDIKSTQTAILLHTGFDAGFNPTTRLWQGVNSVGCFTSNPQTFQKLLDVIGKRSSFQLTLVDANLDLPAAAH